ncbi:MAG: D-alanyl-D-alanine carboxypeptidase [Erysipelotrichaceae bacterium]|nr:D-alanyl-D-alanine carboxypeptidase [Erysipelotrichaceae bacterium]
MIKKFLSLIIIILIASSCKKAEDPFVPHTDDINVFRNESQTLDLDLHSGEYLLADLSEHEILYENLCDLSIYPASLTKVMTMDAVLHHITDLSERSSISQEQINELIAEDASIAYLKGDYAYTVEDLLYALILPSGADGALALENLFEKRGMDLVEEMNILAESLGCSSTHFMNPTGLHDPDHYTSLHDLFLIITDVLRYEEGRKILETVEHTLEDGLKVESTLKPLCQMETAILGGKTGYTPEAGQSILVLFRNSNRSYLLLLGNAMGSYTRKEYWHFEDTVHIFEALFQ